MFTFLLLQIKNTLKYQIKKKISTFGMLLHWYPTKRAKIWCKIEKKGA